MIKKQERLTYKQINQAVTLMQQNEAPLIEHHEIAKKIGLNSECFSQLFTEWAGVNPIQFAYYINPRNTQRLLYTSPTPLFGDSNNTESSSSEQLANIPVEIKSMHLEEYQGKEKKCLIHYQYEESPFGDVLVASIQQGICYMSFSDNRKKALFELKKHFPAAHLTETENPTEKHALQAYAYKKNNIKPIKLYVKGTPFQLKVWKALLEIPMGRLFSYGTIAQKVQQSPAAARAVGNAVGDNPVALLVPCHRIIQSTGLLGGYRWGGDRKAAIIGWELAQINKHNKKM